MLIWLRRIVTAVWLPFLLLTGVAGNRYTDHLMADRPKVADPTQGFTERFAGLKPLILYVRPGEEAQFDFLGLRFGLVFGAGLVSIAIIESFMRREERKKDKKRAGNLFFPGGNQ